MKRNVLFMCADHDAAGSAEAVMKGVGESVRALLLAEKNDAGNTALHVAIANKAFSTALVLVYAGADVREVNSDGHSALVLVLVLSEEVVPDGEGGEEAATPLSFLVEAVLESAGEGTGRNSVGSEGGLGEHNALDVAAGSWGGKEILDDKKKGKGRKYPGHGLDLFSPCGDLAMNVSGKD
jgi:hypothetical protein